MPAHLLAEMVNSTPLLPDTNRLQARLQQDGYLLFRGLLPENEITTARAEVFQRLAAVGELAEPVEAGIYSGSSRRKERTGDLGAFWKSVSDAGAVRRVTNGSTLTAALSAAFGEPARGHDYLFLRAVVAGQFSRIHCDSGFFTRTTERVLTCWIAFTEVPLQRGALFVVEGSHTWPETLATYRGFDVARDTDRTAAIADHPADLAEARGTRLLTADYRPGDVLVFAMYTLHGTFEHHDPDDKIRLTCDVRYQPAADPMDPRYFGPEPGGTTGAGYGELNAARPLNESWHIR